MSNPQSSLASKSTHSFVGSMSSSELRWIPSLQFIFSGSENISMYIAIIDIIQVLILKGKEFALDMSHAMRKPTFCIGENKVIFKDLWLYT